MEPNMPLSLRGYFKKQGTIVGTWKRRFVIVENGSLTYYTTSSDSPRLMPFSADKNTLVVKGTIWLNSYAVTVTAEQYIHVHTQSSKAKNVLLEIIVDENPFRLHEWVSAIRENIYYAKTGAALPISQVPERLRPSDIIDVPIHKTAEVNLGEFYVLPDSFTSEEPAPIKSSARFTSIMKGSLGRVVSALTPRSSQEEYMQMEERLLNQQFEALLIKLKVEIVVRNTLLKSLNRLEKDRALVLAGSLLKDVKHFTKDDADILTCLSGERYPDSLLLLILKSRILACQTSHSWVKSFCAYRGVSILVQLIDVNLERHPLSLLEAACLYELQQCLRAFLRTAALRVVLHTRGAVDAYVAAIDFDYRPVALGLLELLTVCCFRGGPMVVWQVQQGFEALGVKREQRTYGVLISALLTTDIEMQLVVLTFLNTLVLNEPSIGQRFAIRYALQALSFNEILEFIKTKDIIDYEDSARRGLMNMNASFRTHVIKRSREGVLRRNHALEKRLNFLTSNLQKRTELSSQMLFPTTVSLGTIKQTSKGMMKQGRMSMIDMPSARPTGATPQGSPGPPVAIAEDGKSTIDVQNGQMAGHLIVLRDGQVFKSNQGRFYRGDVAPVMWCTLNDDLLIWHMPLSSYKALESESAHEDASLFKTGKRQLSSWMSENQTFRRLSGADLPPHTAPGFMLTKPESSRRSDLSASNPSPQAQIPLGAVSEPDCLIVVGSLHLSKLKEVKRHGTSEAIQAVTSFTFDLDTLDGAKLCLGVPYEVNVDLADAEAKMDSWLTALEISHSRAVRNRSAIVDNYLIIQKDSEDKGKVLEEKTLKLLHKQITVYQKATQHDKKLLIRRIIWAKNKLTTLDVDTLDLARFILSEYSSLHAGDDSLDNKLQRMIHELSIACASKDSSAAEKLVDRLVSECQTVSSTVEEDGIEVSDCDSDNDQGSRSVASLRNSRGFRPARSTIQRYSGGATNFTDVDIRELRSGAFVRSKLKIQDASKYRARADFHKAFKDQLEAFLQSNINSSYAERRRSAVLNVASNGALDGTTGIKADDQSDVIISSASATATTADTDTQNTDSTSDSSKPVVSGSPAASALVVGVGIESSYGSRPGSLEMSSGSRRRAASIDELEVRTRDRRSFTVAYKEQVDVLKRLEDLRVLSPPPLDPQSSPDNAMQVKLFTPLPVISEDRDTSGHKVSTEVRGDSAGVGSPRATLSSLIEPDRSSTVSNATTALPQSERYAKYLKMLTMFPEHVIRMKMTLDKFSTEEIDTFMRNSMSAASNSADDASGRSSSIANNAASTTLPKIVIESLESDYSKYKRLAQSLPEGALRSKMESEGLSRVVVSAFLFEFYKAIADTKSPQKLIEPVITSTGAGLNEDQEKIFQELGIKPKLKIDIPPPSTKMRSVFATKLKVDQIKESMWMEIEDARIDVVQLENLFRDAAPPTEVAERPSLFGNRPNQILSLFSATRTQNVAIGFKKLRKTPEELVEIIRQLDEEVLDRGMLDIMKVITPTPDEIDEVNKRADTELELVGKLFKTLGSVPRLKERLEFQMVAFTWDEQADFVLRDFQIVQDAIEEVMETACINGLKTILGVVITTVNFMNSGTTRAKAYGLKLDILTRLDVIKPVKGNKGTLLHYIYDQYTKIASSQASQEEPPEMFYAAWSALWEAARINLRHSQNHVMEDLRRKIRFARTELEHCQSIKDDDMRIPLASRLELFMGHATDRMSELDEEYEETNKRVKKLRRYFGEPELVVSANVDDRECGSQTLFSTLVSFASKLNQVAKDTETWKYEAEREQVRLARIAAAEQQAATRKQPMKASPSNSPKTGLGPFNGVQLRPVAPLSNLMPTPPIDIGLSSDLFDGDGVAQTSRKDTLNGDDAGGDRDTLLNNVFAELNHELEKSSEEILADFMVKQRGAVDEYSEDEEFDDYEDEEWQG